MIIACMALHNFIRDSAIRDRDFENYVSDTNEGDTLVVESMQ